MNPKYLLICARSRQGFFTNFLHILQYLKDAERQGSIPIIHWEGGVYASRKNKLNGIKSKNIWDYFFEPVSKYKLSDLVSEYDLSQWGNVRTKIKNTEIVWDYRHHRKSFEPPGCWSTKLYPPDPCLNSPTQEARHYVNSIIQKYIKPKIYVSEKIESYAKEKFVGKNVLGIHIRGCKELERDQSHGFVERCVKKAKSYIDAHPGSLIYLATDHVSRLEEMKKHFGDILLYRDTTRSNNEHAVQYGCKPKKKFTPGGAGVAEEVIIDCYLLAKCNHLIRGFSNVPSVSSYINPLMTMESICEYNEDDKKFLGIGSAEYKQHLQREIDGSN